MTLCIICNTDISDRSYRSHLAQKHGLSKKFFCHICTRDFSILSSFKRHIRQNHESSSSLLSHVSSTNASHDEVLVDPAVETADIINNSTAIKDTDNFEKLLAGVVASIYSESNIPRKIVQNQLNDSMCLTYNGILPLFENVLDKFSSPNKSQIMESISGELKKSYDKFSSEYNRFRYFKNLGTFLEPIPVKVGEREDYIKKNEIIKWGSIPCYMYMTNFRNVLKAYLSVPGVLKEILSYIIELEKEKEEISNIIQTNFWKEKRNKIGSNKLILPLYLYTDELEIGNPLGSHAGIHKITAFYASIACTPPWRASTLNSIFLVSLFHSSDRTRFGNDVFYKPIVDELNFLMETGITVENATCKVQVYFALALTLSDNLGHSQALSFTESFSANFPCRICCMDKITLRTSVAEEVSLLRTQDNYEKDLLLKEPSRTGIKGSCVWTDVLHHNIFTGTSVDMMHDIFEGVARIVIPFVLGNFIRNKYFDVERLNMAINTFSYGFDSKNKPSGGITIDHIKDRNMKLSASEMITLIRYLPIMIGELVARDNEVWQLYLYLREMTDFLLRKSITRGSHILLKSIIQNFNECFLRVTGEHLRPKFHFLTHYPEFLNRCGPPVHYWSMRYEANHKIQKLAAKSSANRMNICFSLATKYQLKLNDFLIKNELPIYMKHSSVNFKLSNFQKVFLYKNLPLDETLPLGQVKWFELSSIRYKSNAVLILDPLPNSDYDQVLFIIIEEIFLYNSKDIILMCSKFETIGYDEHLCCFRVRRNNLPEYVSVFFNDLLCSVPHNYNISSDGDGLITLRQGI